MRRLGLSRSVPLFTLATLLAAVVAAGAARTLSSLDAQRKARCISNCKQLALACIMYAQDYDEVLPGCPPNDRNGTRHTVTRLYRNLPRAEFERKVTQTYGPQYLDGRWSWLLEDHLMPYVKSMEIFNCPTLTAYDPRFTARTYVIGTDKQTGSWDEHDPLAARLHGVRKVWQSGSYTYMCCHFPFGPDVLATKYGRRYADDPGLGLFALWDAANVLGYTGHPGYIGPVNPGNFMACGQALGKIADPSRKPLFICDSLGVHEGYDPAYAKTHVIPEAAAIKIGLQDSAMTPTIPVSVPVEYADGHVKYVTASFGDFMKQTFSPNR